MRGRIVLMMLLLLPVAAAQVPGLEDAITDGKAFQYEDQGTRDRIAAVADSITGQGVHDCVADITTDITTAYRVMGTPTQDAFVQKHKDTFTKLGLASDLHHFQNGSAAFGVGGLAFGEGGTNILAVLPGKHLDKWVVIGGHYDTREATLGALDNGSGLCTVHEVARALKADVDANGPYDASIVFAWYDGEEWGLFGAVARMAGAFRSTPGLAGGFSGGKGELFTKNTSCGADFATGSTLIDRGRE